jgi:hypothetical protein
MPGMEASSRAARASQQRSSRLANSGLSKSPVPATTQRILQLGPSKDPSGFFARPQCGQVMRLTSNLTPDLVQME